MWYSRRNFLYYLLKRAFQTENVEILLSLRQFIGDVQKAILQEHENTCLSIDRKKLQWIELYRGMNLSRRGVQRFIDSVGKTISIDGFFSATKNRKFAERAIVRNKNENSGLFGVLLCVQLEIDKQGTIFADLSKFSSDLEEYLFGLSSIFVITHAEFDEEKQVWMIQMTGNAFQ